MTLQQALFNTLGQRVLLFAKCPRSFFDFISKTECLTVASCGKK